MQEPVVSASSVVAKSSDHSSEVGIATGIPCAAAGLGSEEAPVAWGVYRTDPQNEAQFTLMNASACHHLASHSSHRLTRRLSTAIRHVA